MIRESPPDLRHLNGLVQERMPDAERGRLQGESLVGAPSGDPMGLVASLGDEDGEPG